MTGEAGNDRRTTDTRERIEIAALELFTTKGFAATSLRDIADALGISKAAVYYHFPAKADIAHALVQPFLNDMDSFITGAESAGWSSRRVLETYLSALTPHLGILVAMSRDASLLAHVDLDGTSVRWLDDLPKLLLGESPSSAERIQAIIAFSGLGRAMMLPGISLEELRTAGVDAALRALGPGRSEAAEAT